MTSDRSPVTPQTSSPMRWLAAAGAGLLLLGLAGWLWQTSSTPRHHVPQRHAATRPQASTKIHPEPPAAISPTACNGWDKLCGVPYNQITHLTVHNAMANRKQRWPSPYQDSDIIQQLDRGARGLSLEVHAHEGNPFLCLNSCRKQRRLMVETLSEIRAWLGAHPRDVVTLLLHTHAPAPMLKRALEQSELLEQAYAHVGHGDWPALEQMIAEKHRLVIFSDKGGAYPWYHNTWKYAWQTSADVRSAELFSCRVQKGREGARIFILNHFVRRGPRGALRARTLRINKNPFLTDQAQRCFAERGQKPTFLVVDFFEDGVAKEVVATLNEVK